MPITRAQPQRSCTDFLSLHLTPRPSVWHCILDPLHSASLTRNVQNPKNSFPKDSSGETIRSFLVRRADVSPPFFLSLLNSSIHECSQGSPAQIPLPVSPPKRCKDIAKKFSLILKIRTQKRPFPGDEKKWVMSGKHFK